MYTYGGNYRQLACAKIMINQYLLLSCTQDHSYQSKPFRTISVPKPKNYELTVTQTC